MTEREAADRAQIQGQLDGLTVQRNELQQQTGELRRLRNQLDEQRAATAASQRATIDARIAEVDARSARLETQIQSLNDQISATLARRTAVFSGQGSGGSDPQVIRIPQITIPPINIDRSQRRNDMRDIGGIMAAEAVALALIGVFAWRAGMRRMREQFERVFNSQAQQMAQLQQAVDVIGIEVERISEGQRYVAKVLSDGGSRDAALVNQSKAASRNG